MVGFPVAKLLEFADRLDALETNANPSASLTGLIVDDASRAPSPLLLG
jgi:hypothetical protein